MGIEYVGLIIPVTLIVGLVIYLSKHPTHTPNSDKEENYTEGKKNIR